MAQLSIPFQIHAMENNSISQQHLELYREKFNKHCFNVLQRLVLGERLTVKGAMLSGLTNSLPRRILDLKEFGIPVSTNKIEGGCVEYFMSEADKIEALKVLITKAKVAA